MTFDSVRHRVAFQGGSMLLRKERWRPAAFLLGRATKLAPGHRQSHNSLAVALLKLERWEDAAGAAKRAISLEPTAADSHDFFGIALLQLERWEEAVAAYRRAITVNPDRYDSYDRLGMALWRLKRWDEVVETCEAALMLDAGHYAAHHRHGIALLQLGRCDDAAAALRRAIELAADDPAAAAELGGMQLNLANAEAQLDASEERGKAPPRALHPGTVKHLNRGIELLVLEQWGEAVSELAEGSALSPDLGGLHFLRVDPLVRLGRFPCRANRWTRSCASFGTAVATS